MNPERSNPSTPASVSATANRDPPTKRAAVVGGGFGICIGLSSHLVLLDYFLVSITIGLLYALGITLMIDYFSILRQAPDDGGTWWSIAFGATTGLVLMVVQLVFRPVVTEEIAVKRVLPEGATTVPFNLILVLWLFMVGVALVSLTYGIGMAVTDLSEG